MRLCNRDELLTDICCGTGGNCDNHLIWTSTYECVESDDCNEEDGRGCRCWNTDSTDEIVEDDENEDCTRC